MQVPEIGASGCTAYWQTGNANHFPGIVQQIVDGVNP
jgi:hypothetical protein